MSRLLTDLSRQEDLVAADRTATLSEVLDEEWEADHKSAHTTVREAAANSAWWLLALARLDNTPSRSKYRSAAARFMEAARRDADNNDPTTVASIYVAAAVEASGAVTSMLESLGTVSAVEAARADQSYLNSASEWVISGASKIGEYILDIDPVKLDVAPQGDLVDRGMAWVKNHPIAAAGTLAAFSAIGLLAYQRWGQREAGTY
jgi:hypothetical protein